MLLCLARNIIVPSVAPAAFLFMLPRKTEACLESKFLGKLVLVCLTGPLRLCRSNKMSNKELTEYVFEVVVSLISEACKALATMCNCSFLRHFSRTCAFHVASLLYRSTRKVCGCCGRCKLEFYKVYSKNINETSFIYCTSYLQLVFTSVKPSLGKPPTVVKFVAVWTSFSKCRGSVFHWTNFTDADVHMAFYFRSVFCAGLLFAVPLSPKLASTETYITSWTLITFAQMLG